MFNREIRLENERVLLRPLAGSDLDEIKKIAFNEQIWAYSTALLLNETDAENYLEKALKDRETKLRYAFAVIDKKTDQFAGSSSIGNISEKNKRLEIGWTWLGKEFQGTGLNKNCKFLLLRYAFEELEYVRVEFKTDVMNQQARKALLKIGGTEEGVLRSHTLMPRNRRRDTIFYSILDHEWPHIKETVFKDLIGK